MYWSDLNNKTIGIWGMGREGLSARAAIESHCSNSCISEISESDLSVLDKCDILIKSPGVSLYRPEIQNLIRRGIPVISGTNLFFANRPDNAKIIAVTGTKGKSTTSSLLAHTLKTLGQRVLLGGNIGRPLLDFVDEPADLIVAELSSYQCADFVGQPDIGILVNLYPEHLQWHGSHDRYYADKFNMIRQCHQKILNGSDPRTRDLAAGLSATWFNHATGFHLEQDGFYRGRDRLFGRSDLNLVGDHNAENACAVLTAVALLGFNPIDCQTAFRTFSALPHRLQTIGQKDGITYVDDSISTTPETAVAALKALYCGQKIVLIAGGLDRGQDYTVLLDCLAEHPDDLYLVTLPDTGTRLCAQAQNRHLRVSPTSDMPTAVDMARHLLPAGGIVILSPAAPSYNLYRNFEERGADFARWALSDP